MSSDQHTKQRLCFGPMKDKREIMLCVIHSFAKKLPHPFIQHNTSELISLLNFSNPYIKLLLICLIYFSNHYLHTYTHTYTQTYTDIQTHTHTHNIEVSLVVRTESGLRSSILPNERKSVKGHKFTRKKNVGQQQIHTNRATATRHCRLWCSIHFHRLLPKIQLL